MPASASSKPVPRPARAGTRGPGDPAPIRLVVQQPALAKYRVPVFRELASREGIDLTLVYAQRRGIPNVEPDGFRGIFEPMSEPGLFGRRIYWHGAQWRCASPGRSDVLMLSWDLHYAGLIPSLLRARRRGVGTVLWGHGYSKNESAIRFWLRRRSGRLATALLFYNRATAESYIRAGAARERVFVALNSLDQTPIQRERERWLAAPARLDEFRREQGLEGRATVLFVSRLEAANRVDLLLEAASRLAGDLPGLRVVIVGTGAEQDRLESMAGSLGIAGVVRFVGAVYEEDRLAPWFLCSDVFCYPANIGLSLLHAFGYGLPVVTGDDVASQNPEIEALEPGVNGLVYRAGDAASLAASLREIIEEPSRRERMAREAHRTATERFTLANMVDGMVAAVRFAHEHA